MKPIRLDFEAFGAFPGRESIDFTALAPLGLFLVSGATGTGKTTIFDAMCWALYGQMPTKQGAEVRSHHVADEVRTQVTFVFEVAGQRYRVTRNPEQLRPARGGRSGYAIEQAAALLEREIDGVLEPVAHKRSEVEDNCQALIGLDATQFQRVVLLPQGEFARFLQASTTERAGVLTKLFGGALYDRVVDHLKAHRKAVVAAAERHRGQMDGHLDEAYRHLRGAVDHLAAGWTNDPDDPDADPGVLPPPERPEPVDRTALGGALGFLDVWLGELSDQVDQLEAVAATATERHQTAVRAEERRVAAQAHRETLAELAGRATEVAAGRVAAERSARARPLVVLADRKQDLDGKLASAELVRDAAWQELRGLLTRLGVPDDDPDPHVVARHLARRGEDNLAAQQRLTAVSRAEAAVTEAVTARDAAQQAVPTTQTRIEQAQAQQRRWAAQRTEAAEIAATEPSVRTELDTAEPRLAARRALEELGPRIEQAGRDLTDAETHAKGVLARFVATQAPRLAAGLVDGEACPVCGSAEHPAPATDQDEEPVDHAAVTVASDRRAQKQQELENLVTQAGSLRDQLGDAATATVADLEHRVQAARDALARAETAKQTVEELDRRLGETARELSGLDERLDHQRDTVRTTEAALVDAKAQLDTARDQLGTVTAESVDATTETLEAVREPLATYRQAHDRVEKLRPAIAELARQITDASTASGFSDLDAARAVLLECEAEEAAIRRARAHDAAHDTAQGALAELERQGVPSEPVELDGLAAAAERARRIGETRRRHLTRAETLRHAAAGALDTFDGRAGNHAELETRAATARRAVTVCADGGAANRIPLPLWVLARELDRITNAANHHLAEMTGRRYQLSRVPPGRPGRGRTDLDLQVTDAQTGRARSTASLSGGEQFQASLALALGLADVVSHGGTATGKTFEALFVDEGFGSLDRDALDTAVEALVGLHETGRMVGAITHVEAMKEDLHVGIHVHRRDDGVGSTLTVTT